MKAVCLDGTTIECRRFKAIDEGILLFTATGESSEGESGDEDEEDEDERAEEASGFIPHRELRFVIPDDAEVEMLQPGREPQPQQGQQPPQRQQPPAQSPQQQPPQSQPQQAPQQPPQ